MTENRKENKHANPDKMPHKCPSKETLVIRSWNTTNKIHAYLQSEPLVSVTSCVS